MPRPRRWPPRALTVLLVAALAALLLAACGGSAAAGTGAATAGGRVTLRLAYFPNVTHAQPQVGLARGTFVEELGPGVALETKTFNAGPAAIEALFAGAIDAAYVGPNPAVTGYVQSQGKDLRVIAGATSGGALLVVRDGANITQAADFANKKIATPQLGNTQDVAFRSWLQKHGLRDKEHGGTVQVVPTNNADALSLIARGQLDGAWAPEPWATRLVQEANGRVFLDERDLWPDRQFATTVLVVRTRFLRDHPDVVERLLRAHVATTRWIADHPDEAKQLVNAQIQAITGAALPDAVIDGAWRHQQITDDPVVASITRSAEEAFALGFLGERRPNLGGLFALDPLNAVRRDLGLAPVSTSR